MSNPAAALLEILDNWRVPPSTTPEDTRGVAEDGGLVAWHLHAHAAALLREVEAAIDELERRGQALDLYRDVLPNWYAAVWAVRTPFNTADSVNVRSTLGDNARNLLLSLNYLLNVAPGMAAMPAPAQTELREAIDELGAVLMGSDLPDAVKLYMLRMVQELSNTLDNIEAFGATGVRRMTLELGGALTLASGIADERGDTTLGDRFRSLGLRLVSAAFGGAFGGAAGEIGTELARKAIER